VLHDRDAKFCRSFGDVFRSEGAEVLLTPVQAPTANAYAERWVRTVRAECLDWLLILSRGHLEQVLRVDVRHYNGHRPHRALLLQPPHPPAQLTILGEDDRGLCTDATCSAASFTSTDKLHERLAHPSRRYGAGTRQAPAQSWLHGVWGPLSCASREGADAGDRAADDQRVHLAGAVSRLFSSEHAEVVTRTGSDRQGEFVERDRQPSAYRLLDRQLVVAAADVLHKRVPGDDDPGAMVLLQASHRS
jgi:hypothetical protein